MSPLLLDGPAALSVFALAKVQVDVPDIVYAEFVHLLELGEQLNDSQLVQVQQLLSYGPTLELPPKQGQRAPAPPRRPGAPRWPLPSRSRARREPWCVAGDARARIRISIYRLRLHLASNEPAPSR